MTTAKVKRPVERLAYSRAEAAQSLGVSLHYFDEHIVGELKVVYRGRRRLIPRSELERWLRENAIGVLS